MHFLYNFSEAYPITNWDKSWLKPRTKVMTSLVELSSPLVGAISLSSVTASHYNNNKRHRHLLKSKQNKLNVKCNRALKRKLKKYKLRQDGQEDQDILDISNILVTSLIIKSPNNSKETLTDLTEIELLRPKNYLFKMISKKQVGSTLIENSSCTFIEKQQNDNYGNSQEKKQMNAFKLLMDSRYKVIGSNSPGKDMTVDETLVEVILENKSIKAKRLLVLEKMAEAKGSLKKKEMEEYKEKCVRKKLDKRADKFKSMLLNTESKTCSKDKTTQKSNSGNENIKFCTTNHHITKAIEKETKSLQLINIFAESEKNTGEINKEKISKEDNEFLKKLSLPLKKKENMLSYFQKIEKEPECSLSPENEFKTIKVKQTSKKKGKRKRLSLKKEICNSVEKVNVSSDADVVVLKNSDRQKRKRNLESVTESNEKDTKINYEQMSDYRPKRNVKKPVKYSEELYQSSSDEELHIFTPKKKKHIIDRKISSSRSKVHTLPQNTEILTKPVNLENKVKQDSILIKKPKHDMDCTKKTQNNTNVIDKPVKLAPIFKRKQNSDLAAVEAKQKFLNSGVPDQLKKMTSQQKVKSSIIPNFTTVVHIQQMDASFLSKSTTFDYLTNLYLDLEINSKLCEKNLFETLINFTDCDCNTIDKPDMSRNVKDVLHYLKEIKPRFPIYRTYHMLRGKRKGEFKGYMYNDLDNSREVINSIMDTNVENPDQLSWSDRYKATSTNQIIGNFESINELKKWLVSWNENHMKARNANAGSDSSDFYHSDSDSGDSLRNGHNLIVLTGPVGSGKTSSVYAVASELAIKVIEVNVSNKRTGKIMLQDLQEATQSHKVNRGASASENSQKSQEIVSMAEGKTVKKRGRPKKGLEKSKKLEPSVKFDGASSLTVSQEITRTDSSLILIDDADVVFDQDDGFTSAIVQLVQSSKRPVILVISELSCQHLQKFLQNAKILRMNPLSPKILGTWLDIMNLADTGLCFPGAGAKFLNYFKGDIRKSINTLQFYMLTQSQITNEEVDLQTVSTLHSDNENSNMSWANSEDSKDHVIKHITSDSDMNYIWNYFMHKECSLLHTQHPLQIFNIWWSLPYLISNPNKPDRQIENNNLTNNYELQLTSNVVDYISLSDYYNNSNKSRSIDITSSPWSSSEIDNVSEVEDLSCYVRNYETNEEICRELMKNSIKAAQKALGIENRYNIDSPGMFIQR